MSNISFNPYAHNVQSAQTDYSAGAYTRAKDDKASSRFEGEAGSVEFSKERYEQADVYSKNGVLKSSVRAGWKSPIPAITDHEEYGSVIGEPKLSEKATEYYKQLKSKFGNLDFVLVGKDQLQAAKANANSYGNANRLVVLIDEEKLERMATDESFRKKYEGIIAQAQMGGSKLSAMAANNPSIMKLGVNTSDDGKGSFFAVCAKSNADVTKRMEEKREAKKEHAKAEAKKAEKKHFEKLRHERIEKKHEQEEELKERIEERREDKIELSQDALDRFEEFKRTFRNRSVISNDGIDEIFNNDNFEIIYADSMEELADKLASYTGYSE